MNGVRSVLQYLLATFLCFWVVSLLLLVVLLLNTQLGILPAGTLPFGSNAARLILALLLAIPLFARMKRVEARKAAGEREAIASVFQTP